MGVSTEKDNRKKDRGQPLLFDTGQYTMVATPSYTCTIGRYAVYTYVYSSTRGRPNMRQTKIPNVPESTADRNPLCHTDSPALTLRHSPLTAPRSSALEFKWASCMYACLCVTSIPITLARRCFPRHLSLKYTCSRVFVHTCDACTHAHVYTCTRTSTSRLARCARTRVRTQVRTLYTCSRVPEC